MAEEVQKSSSETKESGSAGGGVHVSLMPWNNTGTSATRAFIGVAVIIALPLVAALIYSVVGKGEPDKGGQTTQQK